MLIVKQCLYAKQTNQKKKSVLKTNYKAISPVDSVIPSWVIFDREQNFKKKISH